MLVRVAACAGHERERAAGQADEIAIADVDRRQRKLIAAVASALRDEQTLARHFRQDDGQEFGWNILRLRNDRELHLLLAPLVGKLLEGADRIADLLRQHDGVTVTYSTLIQTVWMRFSGRSEESREGTNCIRTG